jgi:hypothetical protein
MRFYPILEFSYPKVSCITRTPRFWVQFTYFWNYYWIHFYNFWSKYLMIVLISGILVLDIILFEAIFGKMNFFMKVALFYGSSLLFLLLMILINTASSVSFEANKSYKLLNKTFIINNKQISIRMRIKV